MWGTFTFLGGTEGVLASLGAEVPAALRQAGRRGAGPSRGSTCSCGLRGGPGGNPRGGGVRATLARRRGGGQEPGLTEEAKFGRGQGMHRTCAFCQLRGYFSLIRGRFRERMKSRRLCSEGTLVHIPALNNPRAHSFARWAPTTHCLGDY